MQSQRHQALAMRPAFIFCTALLCTIALGCGSEVHLNGSDGPGGNSATNGSGEGGELETPACADGIGPWQEETITDHVNNASNAVLTADGQIHATMQARYLRGQQGAWNIDEIPYEVCMSTLGAGSLAIDDHGHAHLVCGTYQWFYETEYWTNASGNWLGTMIAPSGSGGPASLALSPSGAVHVNYRGFPSGHYSHATLVDQTWIVSELPERPSNSHPPAITFDPAGQLWIAYMQEAAVPELQTLSIQRLDRGGSWARFALENHELAATVYDIASDENGALHLVYTGEYTNVYYGRFEDGAWSSQLISDQVAGIDAAHSPVIAVDGKSQPAIALIPSGDRVPRYLRPDGASWTIEVLGASPVGHITSLMVDEVGAAQMLSVELGHTGAGIETERRLLHHSNRRHCPRR